MYGSILPATIPLLDRGTPWDKSVFEPGGGELFEAVLSREYRGSVVNKTSFQVLILSTFGSTHMKPDIKPRP